MQAGKNQNDKFQQLMLACNLLLKCRQMKYMVTKVILAPNQMLKAPYFFLESNALKIYMRIQRRIFKTKKLLGCKYRHSLIQADSSSSTLTTKEPSHSQVNYLLF